MHKQIRYAHPVDPAKHVVVLLHVHQLAACVVDQVNAVYDVLF